ncbi:MAG: BON domain-containing protein [Planctomycetota bacterium]
MVQGNERFIRGNRRASDFVGADNREAQGFVGQVNAANLNAAQVPTTLGTQRRPNQAPQINRPAQRHRPNTLHYPPLELGFQPEPEAVQQLAASAAERIAQSLDERFGSRIEVSVEERTAILRGEVDSADASRLAALMAGFEPGISTVRNELRVNPGSAPGK